MQQTRASEQVLKLEASSSTRTELKGDAVHLVLERPMLQVTVTVPTEVLEWFVEVLDTSTGASVQDWCDYAGYDVTPREQLDSDMADDVAQFISGLLSRDLRIANHAASKIALEWKVGDAWVRAVPFIGAV